MRDSLPFHVDVQSLRVHMFTCFCLMNSLLSSEMTLACFGVTKIGKTVPHRLVGSGVNAIPLFDKPSTPHSHLPHVQST